MKKIIIHILGIIGLVPFIGFSQENDNEVDFELGKGLNLSFEGGKHNFNLGGYIQLEASYYDFEKKQNQYNFGAKRAFLSFSGAHYQNKFSYLLQMDFVRNYPLLDAWMAYKFSDNWRLTIGQKQSFSATRSMMFQDQALFLGERGLSNRVFFDTGRELGAFLETRYSVNGIGLDAGVAVTSGDGINSFGSESIDFDAGGVKYSTRMTLYPLGFFKKNNDSMALDFGREEKPKMGIGFAYSYNKGVTDKIGEGHNNFHLLDNNGQNLHPDYQKISIDILFKYKGLSILGEMVNATGNKINGLHNPNGLPLKPKEISQYLYLGNGYNMEIGYIFPNNLAVMGRYSLVSPEWSNENKSLDKMQELSAGVAKYLIDNRLKVELSASHHKNTKIEDKNYWQIKFGMHVVF